MTARSRAAVVAVGLVLGRAAAWAQEPPPAPSDLSPPQLLEGGSATYPDEARREVVAESSGYETRVRTRRLREEVGRAEVKLDPSPTVSRWQLTRRDVELTPGSLEDLSRTIQSLPGVVADPGLLATFFVRGGATNEVAFYLDGVPVPNPFHLGGFASLFNPELVREVEVHAGVQPAVYRDSLAGVVDVATVHGDAEHFDGVVDVSMNTAKAVASGPLPLNGASFVVSARRSYYEAYFAALRALGVVGSGFAAPELGEYFAKAELTRGSDELALELVYAQDGLHFSSTQGDQGLITFDGDLRLDDWTLLGSARWRHDFSSSTRLTALAAWVGDAQTSERRGAGSEGAAGALLSSGDLSSRTLVGRLDLRVDGDHQKVSAGLEVARARTSFSGRVTDTRTLPTWAFLPLAEYHLPPLDVAPRLERTEASVHVEGEWPALFAGVTPRLGLRVAVAEGEETLVSPRAALSVPLWAGAVGKLAAGLYWQRPSDPMALDPTFGNPRLRAARVLQGVLGVDQALPAGALVRVEGWGKRLDRLWVSPDTQAGLDVGPVFTNDGRGWAYGGDAIVVWRRDALGVALAYGYLRTERENPLATVYVRQYAPSMDQRHTIGLSGDARLGDRWVFSGRVQVHSGRPYTSVERFVDCPDGGPAACAGHDAGYVPLLGTLQADGRRTVDESRRPWFYELSVRAEYWVRRPSWRMTVYGEIVNVTSLMQPYVETYSAGDPATGVPPEKGAINTLPIRPFVGLRVEL